MILLISAYFMGLVSSLHCMGMCGGIVSALQLSFPAHLSKIKKIRLQIIFHSGRLLSYGAMGVLAGLLGVGILRIIGHGVLFFRLLPSFYLLILAGEVAGIWQWLTFIEQMGAKLWQKILPSARAFWPVQKSYQALLMGLLWGFLPCGLVYSTLLWAVMIATPLFSGLLLMTFGLGTVPALLTIGFFYQCFRTLKTSKILKNALALSLFGFALLSAYFNFFHASPFFAMLCRH